MTPKSRFRDRLRGARPSTNIEDRRGEPMPAGTAPSDSAGIRYGSKPSNAPATLPDLELPVRIPRKMQPVIPVEKARDDRQTSELYHDLAKDGTIPHFRNRRKK